MSCGRRQSRVPALLGVARGCSSIPCAGNPSGRSARWREYHRPRRGQARRSGSGARRRCSRIAAESGSLRGTIGRKNLAGLSIVILMGRLTEKAPPVERAEALKEYCPFGIATGRGHERIPSEGAQTEPSSRPFIVTRIDPGSMAVPAPLFTLNDIDPGRRRVSLSVAICSIMGTPREKYERMPRKYASASSLCRVDIFRRFSTSGCDI